jgi:hypothetical protein
MTFEEKYPTLEEFVKAVKTLTNEYEVPLGLYNQWNVDGASGGSCWGDPATRITPDPEPDFTDLDAILEETYPEISYLKHKALMRKDIFEIDSGEYQEYYGNWTAYKRKTLNLDNLYDALIELG